MSDTSKVGYREWDIEKGVYRGQNIGRDIPGLGYRGQVIGGAISGMGYTGISGVGCR